MKATCLQKKFEKAVFSTEKVTGKQASLPILSNIMIETENGRLKFSATNLEIGVICRIGAKIEEEGRVTVPARLLSNFINNLPAEDKIYIEVKDQTLNISSGKYKTQIKGLDSEEFPIIPKAKEGALFSLNATEFKESISRVLTCVALNETRIEFTGVNMTFSEESISLAATDSFRLAEAIIPIFKKTNTKEYSIFTAKTNSIIVPAVTLHELIRIIGNKDIDEVGVTIGESQIFFEVGDVQIVSRLINGKYPDYKQIIPEQFSTRVVVGKEDIQKAVKVSSIFTDNKAGEVEFKVVSDEKQVVLHSKSQDSGENVTQLDVDVSGPSQEIILNPKYILENCSAKFLVATFDEKNGVGEVDWRDDCEVFN